MAKQTDKIRKQWESKGYFVINLISTSKNGICDYLAMKKGEIDVFIESKETWDKLSELQKHRINEILDLGKRVMINDIEVLDKFEFDKLNF